ncbi:hypothetical protein [Streptomyces sp. NBC_00859]|uniref:hypothetical protein n=1 Tax=Streptomyces sp. NBC_00859 TaxID=2903682 RepID=UPI00386671A2|nr:hypothetical protein OG584_23400 [Streptomyces sp. NBC_00859]
MIVPHIGGAPLTELIDGFEMDAGMQPAGDAYGGLIPEFFRFGPMEDHFRGRSTSATGSETPVSRLRMRRLGMLAAHGSHQSDS